MVSWWNGKTSAAMEPTMTHSNNVTPTKRPLLVSSSSSTATTRYCMNEQEDSIEACIVSNPVDHQIRYAATAAAIMCLLSSMAMVQVDHPAAFMYTAWWIWSLALWIGSPKKKDMMNEGWLSWALGVSILMAVHHHMTTIFINHNHYPYLLHAAALLVIPGTCLFWFARQLHAAHDHHRRELLRRISLEHASSHRLKMLDAVAQEMQGVAGMITTTLEHFSPTSILARTHELLSACTIAVPITSISAIHTAIKQVHHVSDNLDLVTRLLTSPTHHHHHSDTLSQQHHDTQEDALPSNDVQFDIGGLVQNVGDALAGMAAKLDVYLVIYHADNGLHYSNVTGNEGIIRHTLLDASTPPVQEIDFLPLTSFFYLAVITYHGRGMHTRCYSRSGIGNDIHQSWHETHHIGYCTYMFTSHSYQLGSSAYTKFQFYSSVTATCWRKLGGGRNGSWTHTLSIDT